MAVLASLKGCLGWYQVYNIMRCCCFHITRKCFLMGFRCLMFFKSSGLFASLLPVGEALFCKCVSLNQWLNRERISFCSFETSEAKDSIFIFVVVQPRVIVIPSWLKRSFMAFWSTFRIVVITWLIWTV